MSRLALEYLQRNYKLPRTPTGVEQDLSSGYLFALVLHQCGCLAADDLEQCVDDGIPEKVLQNFRLVSRALRQLDIHLTKQNVAAIISEQPGASASIVMQIKRVLEEKSSGKSSALALVKYKDSIKSLRPKEFVRESDKYNNLSSEEKYAFDAKSSLDRGVFADVDMRTYIGAPYETFKHQTDARLKQEAVALVETNLAVRTQKHDLSATRRKETQHTNQLRQDHITVKWAETLEIKRQRHVRDLQFELATSKVAQLTKQNRSNNYNNEQKLGIEAFEAGLKRNGIGGGDDDGGQGLAVSYEDADAFLLRVEEVAKKGWPTKEDASDFLTQLKLRTADKRTTRYEQARRRRKILLEQTQAAANVTSTSEELGGEQATETGTLTVQNTKSIEDKAAKLEESLEVGKQTMARISAAAEEEIRVWAEQYRMQAEEKSEETAAALNEVIRASAVRKEQRHQRNEELCREVVKDMVADIFDGGHKQKKKQQQQQKVETVKPAISNPSEFSRQLLQLAHSRLQEFDGPVISMSDLLSLDSWPATSTVASNIGKWSVLEMSSPSVGAQVTDAIVLDVEVEKQGAGNEMETEVGVSNNVLGDETSPQLNTVLTVQRSDSFVEIAQNVLETVLERAAALAIRTLVGNNVAPAGEPDFTLTLGERAEYESRTKSSSTTNVILILTDGSYLPPSTWTRSILWLGPDLAFLWDSLAALEASSKIKPLMEGKTPTVTFSALVGILLGENVAYPPELASLPLPPTVLRACTDLVEMSTRVLSVQLDAATSATVSTLPFNETTLAMLLGQTLWIRSFLLEKMLEKDSASFESYKIPRLALVAKRFDDGISTADTAVFAKIVDWFVRGGTRDNIPAGEVKLLEALQGEADKAAGGGKKKAAPPAKGKGGEPTITEQCSLQATLWVRGGQTRATLEQKVDNEQSTARTILDAFCGAVWGSIEGSFHQDKEELELLEFAHKTSVAMDGNKLRPLSIYCLEKEEVILPMTPSSTEEVNADSDNIQAEEAGVSSDPDLVVVAHSIRKHPIEIAFPFKAEIFLSEAIVSIALAAVEDAAIASPISEAPEDIKTEEEATLKQIMASLLLRVTHIMEIRQGRLTPSEKVWYLHLTEKNTLKLPDAFDAHSGICEAQALEKELFGICLMAIEQGMLTIHQRARERQALLVAELKASDSRWQGFCQQSRSSSAEVEVGNGAVTTKFRDLICRLGDVIDERHMNWLKMLEQCERESFEDIENFKRSMLHISELLCSCSFRILECKRQAAISTAALLSSSDYVEFPWPLSSVTAGTRMLLDRRRDDVRASALVLASACGSNHDEEEEGGVASWRDFSSVELPHQLATDNDASIQLSTAALTEVYAESLSVATALLSAALQGLNSCILGSHGTTNKMRDMVHCRHEYEHTSLADWGRKLMNEGQQFLLQSAFGCSDSGDGVEVIVGKAICEARHMTLTLPQILAFAGFVSEEIYFKPSPPETALAGESFGVGEPVPLPPVNRKDALLNITLRSAIKVGQKDPTLSRSWRNPESVSLFINNMIAQLASSTISEDVESRSVEQTEAVLFFRHILLFLVLSAIQIAPSGEVLARLAKTLGLGLTRDGERLTCTMTALQDKVNNDSRIKEFAGAIGAIAYCCLDSSGHVVVEELLLTLCRCPPRLPIGNDFDKWLILADGRGPMAEDYDPLVLKLLPAFIQDGAFKALQVAASVEIEIEIQEGEAFAEGVIRSDRVVSQGAQHLQSVSSTFLMDARQAQWLASHLSFEVITKFDPHLSFVMQTPSPPPLPSSKGEGEDEDVVNEQQQLLLEEKLPEEKTEWVPVTIFARDSYGSSSKLVTTNYQLLDKLVFRCTC